MNLLEKVLFSALCLYAVFAPHSICLSEAAIIIGLLAWAGKAIIFRKNEKLGSGQANLTLPIVSFCAVSVISVLTSYDHFQAIKQIKSLWLFLFYFLLVHNIKDRKKLIIILNLLIISTTVAAGYGLYQYFFRHTVAVTAFIKNIITLAGFFLLTLPLAFSLFLKENVFKKKAIYLLVTLLIFFGLIFTLERSIWLGLVIEILTFIFLSRRSLQALCLGILIIIFLFFLCPAIKERLRTMMDLRSYPIVSRFHQWQSGLEMMLDHPLTGVGPGNYEVMYRQYKFFEERKTYPHSHSNIVQVGAETGVLGLAVFFWIMVVIFKTMLAGLKDSQDKLRQGLCFGALAGFMGFNFAGLFEYNFGDSEVQLLFWFIVGCMERIGKIDEKNA